MGQKPITFLVRVVGPSGMVRYLSEDQREVEMEKDAQQFSTPWEADKAADEYLAVARKCWPCPPILGVVNLNDEEWRS